MISRSNYNKYDVFLFLLIASLIGGNLFGALQVPRVLALLFAIPCMNCKNNAVLVARSAKTWLMAFVIFSFVSSLWSPAGISQAINGSLYNAIHALLFYEIIIFSGSAKKPINSIALGFFVAFAIAALIAFWELTTDNHLDTSKTKEAKASNIGFEVYMRYFAAATFYNFNMFVTFLCLIFPFIAFGFANTEYKSKYRFVALAASVIAIILTLYNGSRGGLLAMAIMGVILAIKIRKGRGTSFYLITGIGAVAYLLVKYGSTILLTLTMRSQVQVSLQEEDRFEIWANVFKVIADYPLIGCGTDGLNFAMQEYTTGVTISHNLFLEVLSQYGLVFTIAFISFLIGIFKQAKLNENPARKLCVLMSLISLPVVAIINSHYISAPSLWAVMASLYVFANYERIRSFY